MQKKQEEGQPNKTEEPQKELQTSFDSTFIKDGNPIQEETREKDLYREEHGDLTNEPT